MSTTIYIEPNGDHSIDNPLYMAWTAHPAIFGLNLCVFAEDPVIAVQNLIVHTTSPNLPDLPRPITVSDGIYETDLTTFVEEGFSA